jgi:hypothetical protein
MDKILVEYSEQSFRDLLKKYFEIHKDIDMAFNQLSEDLRDKVRNK